MSNYPPEVRKMQAAPPNFQPEKPRVYKRLNSNGDYSPRTVPPKFSTKPDRIPSHGLVEPMQYLFTKIVKARGLAPNESPFVKIWTSNHFVRSKPAMIRAGDVAEWNGSDTNAFTEQIGVERPVINEREAGVMVEEWVELANECICSTVKHSLVHTLEQPVQGKERLSIFN